MFLILGLLVYPSRLLEVAAVGLGLALLLAIVVRPLVVALCLLPFRYPRREVLYHRLGRASGRGADRAGDLPGAGRRARRRPDLPPGVLHRGGQRAGARRDGSLGDSPARAPEHEPPAPQAVLAIESRQPLQGELMSFYIDEALVVAGMPLGELPLPEGSAVTLIVRKTACFLQRPMHCWSRATTCI